MKYRTQLIDLVVFFNCSDFGEATELRLGGNFLSQVSYSGVETKDTNSQFKILKLGRRFGSAPPTYEMNLGEIGGQSGLINSDA